MSTVQEIEVAIEGLPRQDFLDLVDRLRGRHADEWDRQIEEDALAGLLDTLWEAARREIAAKKFHDGPRKFARSAAAFL
jgi:hypothetical protein